MKFIRIFIIFPLLLYGIYTFWSRADRAAPELNLDLQIKEIKSIGKDNKKGNVVGIQPFMYPIDYASEANFYTKMDAYFYEAQKQRFLDSNTVVLLPEYLATWLVVAHEKQAIYFQTRLEEAMMLMLLSNISSFWQIEVPETVRETIPYSLFVMKAPQMAQIYQNVFSLLAQKYGVTIIAGSILLPEPSLVNDRLQVAKGNLYNISLIFKPNGKPYPQIVKKAFPIAQEQPFLSRCMPQEIPAFDLPIGKTGVLICADSWFGDAYQTLQNQQVSFVAVPSFVSGNEAWSKTWQGYSGFASPTETTPDINRITEEQAWLKYAMAGKLEQYNLKNGFNVFLRGNLWDLGSDGYSIVVKDGKLEAGSKVNGASLICFWL
ncbi:MAG: carbon-nitrogen hydrolase family protein [Microscillaceae bacterium]|jgi:predicted amidohydrolase|nr:carbon-nitrogen hydrolase family protein [Microscillaceae bacterium]